MHDCHSKYIISFFGAFLADPNICICMEFMDKGSLDGIYKKIGPIDIDVVGHVALAVLEGLTYLYDVHRIIHRGQYITLATSTNFVIYSVILTNEIYRYQTFQYSLQFERRNQDMRFWGVWRAHQLYRRHVRGHFHLYERMSLPISRRLHVLTRVLPLSP